MEVTFEGLAAGGSFNLPVTQSREHLSANKYSITDEGGGVITGVGSRPGAPIYDGQLQLQATLSGTTLSGNAFWQPNCPGGCCDAFEVTRVP